jgi:hypothetical protein
VKDVNEEPTKLTLDNNKVVTLYWWFTKFGLV